MIMFEIESIRLEILDDFAEILFDKVRQHEAVVKLRAPANEFSAVRLFPKTGDQRAQACAWPLACLQLAARRCRGGRSRV